MKAGLAFVCVCFLFFRTGDCVVTFSKPSTNPATISLKEGSTTIYTAVAAGTGPIIYTVPKAKQAPAETFKIDGSTGVITLVAGKKLDYETAPKLTLEIEATDKSATITAGLTSTSTLTITVTDLSTTPTFTDPPFCVTVTTGDVSGKTVGTYAVTVADPDETITYTFASGNTDTKFAVSNAGVVTTASAVTASDKFPYTLVLKATPSVKTTATSTATLSVIRDGTCSGATDHKSITMATVGTLLLLIVSRVV